MAVETRSPGWSRPDDSPALTYDDQTPCMPRQLAAGRRSSAPDDGWRAPPPPPPGGWRSPPPRHTRSPTLSGLLTTCAVRQGTIWWRWPEPRMGGTGESTAATVPARLQVLPASTRWDNPAYIRWPIFGGCKSSLWRRNDKNRGQVAHQIILTVKMSALVFSRIEQVSTWAILVPNDLEEMRTEINTVYIYMYLRCSNWYQCSSLEAVLNGPFIYYVMTDRGRQHSTILYFFVWDMQYRWSISKSQFE